MARLEKRGLDYFSHDTDMFFDTKMKYIRAKHKLLGYAVYNRLLEIIYRDKGYYLDLSDEYILILSDELRISQVELETIINDFIERELFSKSKFDDYQILTSKRVQENYVRGCERRKSIHLCNEYLLVDPQSIINEDAKLKPQIFINGINENINRINVNINLDNDEINSQSKSKRKKSETKVNLQESLESNSDFLTSDFDLPLPTLTDINNYLPLNFDDDNSLRESINRLLTDLTIQPDKSTLTSFFNIVSKKNELTKQVKKESSFKMLFELCMNWKTFSPEQKNFSYLYSAFSGKIKDRLIAVRENNNAKSKIDEKTEIKNLSNPDVIDTLDKISESMKVA